MTGEGERSSGRWFNLGGDAGGGTASNNQSSSRWPNLGDLNIPGLRQQQQETSFTDEMCEICPTLSFQHRLIGFGSCLALGYLLSFLSTTMIITGELTGFATIYCLGSLIAIAATGFLIGPRRQCKKMFHKKRRISCIVYLVLLIAVLALALAGLPFGLILLMLVLQMMAAIWYTASYIPYGRSMIRSVVCPCLKDLESDGQSG